MSSLQNKKHLIAVDNPRSPVSEAFRSLRTSVDFSSVDKETQVIMVSSASPEEGKSTVIANLAVTYAQTDRKIILIDADLRRPTVHRTFSLSNQNGLSYYLSRQCSLPDVIQKTSIPNLDIITSGVIPPNPAEMLDSNQMSELLSELREQYDIILVDTAPLLAVTDGQLLASKSDGVILVISSGKVKRDLVVKAKMSLERANARILGVVLNNVKKKSAEGYYDYYG